MQIAGREKLDFIIGKSSPRDEKDPTFSKWYVEDMKVKGWLLTSMSPEIMKRYLHLHTAHEIWSALAKTFYDGLDKAQIFALNQRTFAARQSVDLFPHIMGS